MTNQRGARGNGGRDSRSEINNSATTVAEEQKRLIDAGKLCRVGMYAPVTKQKIIILLTFLVELI